MSHVIIVGKQEVLSKHSKSFLFLLIQSHPFHELRTKRVEVESPPRMITSVFCSFHPLSLSWQSCAQPICDDTRSCDRLRCFLAYQTLERQRMVYLFASTASRALQIVFKLSILSFGGKTRIVTHFLHLSSMRARIGFIIHDMGNGARENNRQIIEKKKS